MESQVTALDARRLAAKHDRQYTEVCDTIKQAAESGKHEVTVDEIKCHEIRARLDNDNFDLTCTEVSKGKYTTRIWWGS